MNLTVVPLTETGGKQRVIDLLKGLLERAEGGEIIGIAYVTEELNAFGWGKANMTYPMILGAFARASHHVNKEWDAYSPK